MLILFSANPATYNRSGKVIPQLKDRIGSVIHTHYPLERDQGIEIMEQEAGIDLGGDWPVVVPYFMKQLIEQITVQARKSKYIDQASGVSARFSIANYRTMVASARQRVGAPRREAGRAADQRPGPPLQLVARQAGARPDGQPPDVRAASARRRRSPKRSASSSTNTSKSTASPRSPRSSATASRSKSATCSPRKHYADRLKRVPPALGQSLRGQRLRRPDHPRLLRRIRPRRPLRHGKNQPRRSSTGGWCMKSGSYLTSTAGIASPRRPRRDSRRVDAAVNPGAHAGLCAAWTRRLTNTRIYECGSAALLDDVRGGFDGLGRGEAEGGFGAGDDEGLGEFSSMICLSSSASIDFDLDQPLGQGFERGAARLENVPDLFDRLVDDPPHFLVDLAQPSARCSARAFLRRAAMARNGERLLSR